MDETRLVEVYRAQNAPQAHMVQAALEEAGIKSSIEGELLQGGMGVLPPGWATAPRILVNEADADRAREILSQIEKAEEPRD